MGHSLDQPLPVWCDRPGGTDHLEYLGELIDGALMCAGSAEHFQGEVNQIQEKVTVRLALSIQRVMRYPAVGVLPVQLDLEPEFDYLEHLRDGVSMLVLEEIAVQPDGERVLDVRRYTRSQGVEFVLLRPELPSL